MKMKLKNVFGLAVKILFKSENPNDCVRYCQEFKQKKHELQSKRHNIQQEKETEKETTDY